MTAIVHLLSAYLEDILELMPEDEALRRKRGQRKPDGNI